MDYIDIFTNLENNMAIKNDVQLILSGVKIWQSGNRILYYLQGGPERAFVREELMQVPETTEKPLDCVQGWK